MSPRTRMALMAEPGSSGSGCLLSLTEPTPITGTIPAGGELRSETLHGLLRESVEHQRGFDRLQIVGIVLAARPTQDVNSRAASLGGRVNR